MKLRLEKGSLKIRLTQKEIDLLNSEKYISEQLYISKENVFSYSIHIVKEQKSLIVLFENNTLRITVPETMANKWLNSRQIGLRESIESNNGDSLEIVLEEDLPPRKMKQKSSN